MDEFTGKVTLHLTSDENFLAHLTDGCLFGRLGMTDPQSDPYGYIIFGNMPDIGISKYLELYIETFENEVTTSDSSSRATSFFIPLSGLPVTLGNLICWNNNSGSSRCDQNEIPYDRLLDKFWVVLRHSDGSIVALNGLDWTAVFLIY